ncbi:MAG: glycosyltransferase [Actinomycetota bacterium]|nr:glycosyltransferase [Actinomycetota bacterium]
MASSKPRVVVYRDRLLPLSETFVLDQAEAFTQFSPHYVGSTRDHGGLKLPRGRTTVLNPGTRYGRAAELTFKLTGRSATLRRHLTRLEPALIHAHFGPDATIVLPLAARLGLPLVCTFHGYDATVADSAMRDSRAWRLYVRRRPALAEYVTLVVAVSEFVASRIHARGFSKDKIEVHNIGVDTRLFSPVSLERENLVLFVGRLVESKGCVHLIDALAQVQRTRPVGLVVIGDGPLRAALEQRATRLLEGVRFLGPQPRSEVKRWLNRAKVFCVPPVVSSSGNAEGFGLVFLEAQAMGTPVVTFGSGGVAEAVDHAATGFVETPGDDDALARRIVMLLDDDGLWRRLSDAGMARIRKDFDLEVQSRKLEQLYLDRVLQQGSP